MSRRGGCDNLQSWKERFVQLMEKHKPQDKWVLDSSTDLSATDLPSGWYKYEQSHLFARFECSYCSKKWKSIQVVIHFHMHLDKRRWSQSQGQVKMRIFRQKCQKCKNAKYEMPVFSEEAVEKLLQNLTLKILKKCYGESSKSNQFFKPVAEEEVEGPHDRRNCEACQEGMCEAVSLYVRMCQATQWEEKQKILGFLLVVLMIFLFFCAASLLACKLFLPFCSFNQCSWLQSFPVTNIIIKLSAGLNL
ncbi:receptor-transporting protein 3-like [Eublepharis macularius]|uniref:Receptor-transporting protein 3-like n=1 Tax=Eublepharis macularius TaxID=481883 RepID=A0AA97JJK5_EUBMA|nr:receptor-transporting protein 3-like [Eublepharis macularius]